MLRILLSAVMALCFVTPALADGKWWTGLVAVEESEKVWEIARAYNFDDGQMIVAFEKALKKGEIKPATGTFTFLGYLSGNPTGETHVVTLELEHNGTWYFEAPDSMKAPGRDICVKAPSSWPAIGLQKAFPANGGPTVNCHGSIETRHDDPAFANSKDNAAAIWMVKPKG